MLRYCYIHKGIFGIKRPLLNFQKTSGICKKCLPRERLKVRLWLETARIKDQLERENGESRRDPPTEPLFRNLHAEDPHEKLGEKIVPGIWGLFRLLKKL